mgnify:CR=1 FL=1
MASFHTPVKPHETSGGQPAIVDTPQPASPAPSNAPSLDLQGKVIVYFADSNTAWSVDWITPEKRNELRATLRTFAGMSKVHRQFYHLNAKELSRFVLPVFDQADHAEIRKLIHTVIYKCPVCRKHARPAPRPHGQTKGLWAQHPNDLVCGDTFFVTQIAVMHFLDLFSGWSLLYITENEQAEATPSLTEAAFYLWISIFGGAPRVFFSDQGGEFQAVTLEDMFRAHGTRRFVSPAQSPFLFPNFTRFATVSMTDQKKASPVNRPSST